MFEHRKQPLLPRIAFIVRLARSGAVALGIVIFAWVIGAVGYHRLAGLAWIDSLYNAAMILAGMGPVDTLSNPPAKLFASVYALCSGFLFLTVAGFLLAPLLHRMLHRFHWDPDSDEAAQPPQG